jgi:hypothetical protein
MSIPANVVRTSFVSCYRPRLEPILGVGGCYLKVLSLRALQEGIFPRVRDDQDITVSLLALSLCDEDGVPIFAPDDPELVELAGGPLVDLAKRAADLNGLTATAEDTARKN